MARTRSYFSTRARQTRNKTEHVPARILVREPVPLDPGRPSLAQLPDDVVLLVLSFVDKSDLRKVASLSSAFYEKARRVQYHTVHINLSQRPEGLGRLDVLARNLLLPAVRVLEVDSSSSNVAQEGEEGDKMLLTRLAEMLPNMTGLRDLHWYSNGHLPFVSRDWHRHVPALIPRAFLDRVPTRARLHTCVGSIATDESHGQARAFLAQLADNSNLFSLSVHIAFVGEHACRATMRLLKQVLLSCPRLTRIPLLYVGPPEAVVDLSRPGAPYCGLGLSGGERPPALEELGVSIYPWGYVPTPALLAMPGIYCAAYPEKVHELQYWAETFDWSRLRRLNDMPSPLALEMVPKLTALREVVFEHRFDRQWDKATFLEQVPTELELVSIPGWSYVRKPGPITRHGAALRKLTIHCMEPWMAGSLVTDAHLVALCNGLPHLTELALDIARDKNENDWPYSSLEIIARFPCLRSVKLWFELGYGLPAPPIPHVTVSTARYLFAYLRERNRNIQRLELCSGAPSAPNTATWTPDADWAMQNSLRLLCEVSLRDGDAADGFIRVTSPDFSKEMNAELGRRVMENSAAGRRGLAADGMGLLKLEVALDGPLTLQEWKTWVERTQRCEAQRRQKSALRRLLAWISRCISNAVNRFGSCWAS
jgi:F-box domain